MLLPHTGNYRPGIKEDRARGMSEMRLGSITRSLWTYSRFLSKHPVQDTYGVIETPENSGLTPPLTRQLSQSSLPIVRQLGLGRTEIGKAEISYEHPISKKHFEIRFNTKVNKHQPINSYLL